MEKLEVMTGIATMNDVPCVIFLNFGPEPQSAVGSTQDFGTDYSNIKKFAHNNFELDENGGAFSKRVENLWDKEKLLSETKSPVRSVFKYLYCRYVNFEQRLVWEKFSGLWALLLRTNHVDDSQTDNCLTLYLICKFYPLHIQQQIRISCQKYGQMGIHLSD